MSNFEVCDLKPFPLQLQFCMFSVVVRESEPSSRLFLRGDHFVVAAAVTGLLTRDKVNKFLTVALHHPDPQKRYNRANLY